MKVPEADHRVGGEAADARAAGKFVYGFSKDLGAEDVLALCGGKGAGLMRMRRLGFPVPEGFIITTAACVFYIRSGELYPKV
jgi:pyruvate, orthophosphate dikinase